MYVCNFFVKIVIKKIFSRNFEKLWIKKIFLMIFLITDLFKKKTFRIINLEL